MKRKLFIVDGHYLVYRSHYALAQLRNTQGKSTGAVFGFIKTMLKLMREQAPDYLVVAFDSREKTFREERYQQYKANRAATPEAIINQMPHIFRFLANVRIPAIIRPGYEADDIIATLAGKAKARDIEAHIFTRDKDLMQLISPAIHMLYYDNEWQHLDHNWVQNKFGIAPGQMADYLALVGDASDNVPGVPGIGKKTAAKLLARFASINGIYDNLGSLPLKTRQQLQQGRDKAFLSYELVRLKQDLDIPLELELWQTSRIDLPGCRELLEELEFFSLVKDLAPGAQADTLAYTTEVVRTEAALEHLAARLRDAGTVAIDTETDSPDPMRANLVGISICFEPGRGYYIPVGYPEGDPQTPLFGPKILRRVLVPWLTAGKGLLVGQNIKYDLLVLSRHFGCAIPFALFDTMIAAHMLRPDANRYSLDFLTRTYLGCDKRTYTDLLDAYPDAQDLTQVPVEAVAAYAIEDVVATCGLHALFTAKLRDSSLSRVFDSLEMPLVHVLTAMEHAGIGLDVALLADVKTELQHTLEHLEQQIYHLAGRSFNIQSTKELQVILFDDLNLPKLKKTKTGYSTSMDVLRQLAAMHPLPELLVGFRATAKLLNTYVDVLPGLVNPQTGRVHTSFHQAVVATGRISSSDPNLQNIPVRTPEGRRIRSAFRAQDGYLFLSADYSQIDLRLLAHFSLDPMLVEAFEQNKDIHRFTAAQLFSMAEEDVTTDMRRTAKAVNFGIIYGLTPFGLSKQLAIPLKQAKAYIQRFFTRYGQVGRFRDQAVALAAEQGFVTTLSGRRRYVPQLASSNRNTRRQGERIAVNTIIQGSSADVIKQAMLALDREFQAHGETLRLVLQIHDELLFEVRQDAIDRCADPIRRLMEGVQLHVPLRVKLVYGKRWGNLSFSVDNDPDTL